MTSPTPTTRLKDRASWIAAMVCLLICSRAAADGEAAAPAVVDTDPYQAVLWMGGMTKIRQSYEFAVAQLALEKTREQYGDYSLVRDDTPVSSDRAVREVRRGELFNMASGPAWIESFGEDPPLLVIPIPIAKGMLGYRLCVVRNGDLETFKQLETLEELRQYTAGVGREWLETPVFDHNELPWLAGRDIEQLYSMLARERFDYLPLGSLEAESTLAESGLGEQLSVVPNLVIYYPLPVFLQVSINRPQLAERIEAGLTLARHDGSLDALFAEYYGDLVARLRSANPTVVTLENPDMPPFLRDEGPALLPSAARRH